MKTHILCSITFFRKLHRLWNNDEKYGEETGTTNDVTIWRIRVACWISKATCSYAHAHAHAPGYPHTYTHTHTNNWYVLLFHSNNDSQTRLNVTLFVHCRYWFIFSASSMTVLNIVACKGTVTTIPSSHRKQKIKPLSAYMSKRIKVKVKVFRSHWTDIN